MKKNNFLGYAVAFSLLFSPSDLFAQAKGLREFQVPSQIGGSNSPLWVADRSGSFERHGIKVLPIYVRSGIQVIQTLLSRDVYMGFAGGSGIISAWAHGAKELSIIGAAVNRLDYVFVTSAAIKKPSDLKGKKVAISQFGGTADFLVRQAIRQLGLNPENDVAIIGLGPQSERWTALAGGQVDATVFQPPVTLRVRKAGFPVWVDFSKSDYEYLVTGPVTTRSFIRSEPQTVMNFLRGFADGMDFYRDEKNKASVLRFLGEYYKSSNTEELEETRRVYSQIMLRLPIVTAKSLENIISNDRTLVKMNINAAEILDLSFLQRLEEERKTKGD